MANALETYGNKIRVRACGLCWKGNSILLINHKNLYGHDFWAPPGGGIEFGETIENALKREFLEECKIGVKVLDFAFGCELIRDPLHAIELFYRVQLLGEPKLGQDPETLDNPLLTDIRFIDFGDLKSLPVNNYHRIFEHVKTLYDLEKLKGFYRLPDV